MTSCAAYGCTNRPSKKIPGITFHRFPKNPELRAAWIKAIRRMNWEPTKYSRLCSEHFSEDQIDKYSQHRVYLRENAVPNVFKKFPAYLQQAPKEVHVPQVISKEEVHGSPVEVRSLQDIIKQEIIRLKLTVVRYPQELLTKEPVVLKSGTVSKTFKHSPAEVELLQKLNEVWRRNLEYKKKIKSLHQARRRHDRTIRQLKVLLKDLKKKTAVNDESHDDDQKILSESILTPDGTVALQIIKI